MAEEYTFDSIDFITVGTIGEPGQRVFHLQVGKGQRLLTLILEKEQAAALSASIKNVLEEIEKQFGRTTAEPDLSESDYELREPILPSFRIAQIGLGYDDRSDRVLLVVSELLPEDAAQEPRSAQVSASRDQMRGLAEFAARVVVAGRPTAQSNGKPRT